MQTRALGAFVVGVTLATLSLTLDVGRADEVPLASGAQLTLHKAVELALRYHPARLAAQAQAGAR